MQIHGPSNIHGARPISQNLKAGAVQQPQQPATLDTVDQLEISREAQSMLSAQAAGEIRADKVAEIRAQIAAGRYETVEKVSIAVDRLLDRLA